MATLKYFAFGSNLCLERIRLRLETIFNKIKPGTPYVLNGWKLIFNCSLKHSEFSYANIIPSNYHKVEGLLYDLTESQFRELDNYEALYKREYFIIDVNTIGCCYIAQDYAIGKEKKPLLSYLNIMLDGAKKANLQETYDKLLEYKKKNYKLKLKKRYL